MRKLSADYIFPIASPPIKNGVVTINEEGVILDISENNNQKEVEHYEGIICPGFVNTHCHLELSHLKGKVKEGKGLDNFIREVQNVRGNDNPEKEILATEKEMIRNGIVAVGDISNSDATFSHKKKGNLKYHTFIEVFGFDAEKAEEIFERAVNLQSSVIGHRSSVVPHSPYSVSEKLFSLIAGKSPRILTIHNQESKEENEMFVSKSGKLLEMLESFKIDISNWKHTGKSSLFSILDHFSHEQKILLVHNTYTSEQDIIEAEKKNKNLWWCFCPNANLYIEKRLPEIQLFIKNNCKITLGTDSLASNHQLSILEEMKTIAEHLPEIALNDLLTWGTKNGADFLEFSELGTIVKGKKPGLNLIWNVDLEKLKLTSNSEIKKLG